MTIGQQIVSTVVSCAVALISSADAGEDSRAGNEHAGSAGDASVEKDRETFFVPAADDSESVFLAVPEPAAILIGSLGLLALVRRRRG